MKRFILVSFIVINIVLLIINIVCFMLSTMFHTPYFNNKLSPFVVDAVVKVDSITSKYIDYQHSYFTNGRVFIVDVSFTAPKDMFISGDTIEVSKFKRNINTTSIVTIPQLNIKPVVKDTIKIKRDTLSIKSSIVPKKDTVINIIDTIQ